MTLTTEQMDRIIAAYAAACPQDFGETDPHYIAEQSQTALTLDQVIERLNGVSQADLDAIAYDSTNYAGIVAARNAAGSGYCNTDDMAATMREGGIAAAVIAEEIDPRKILDYQAAQDEKAFLRDQWLIGLGDQEADMRDWLQIRDSE